MAIKPDHKPLLQPGIHKMSFLELKNFAVNPFPMDEKRKLLFQKLNLWETAIRACGIKGTLWIDGSFLTEKPEPNDIDCVLWNPHFSQPHQDTQENQLALSRLFDRGTAMALYGLDFYIENPSQDELFDHEAYWRGVFGFCHDRVTAKGFVEVNL